MVARSGTAKASSVSSPQRCNAYTPMALRSGLASAGFYSVELHRPRSQGAASFSGGSILPVKLPSLRTKGCLSKAHPPSIWRGSHRTRLSTGTAFRWLAHCGLFPSSHYPQKRAAGADLSANRFRTGFFRSPRSDRPTGATPFLLLHIWHAYPDRWRLAPAARTGQPCVGTTHPRTSADFAASGLRKSEQFCSRHLETDLM